MEDGAQLRIVEKSEATGRPFPNSPPTWVHPTPQRSLLRRSANKVVFRPLKKYILHLTLPAPEMGERNSARALRCRIDGF